MSELWKATPLPNRENDDLFVAIVTAQDDRQLIAQCTTLYFAKEIADHHNRFDTELRAAAAERDDWKARYEDAYNRWQNAKDERDELKAKANVSICAWCGQECEKSATGIAEHVITCEKRPEHAMLVEFEKSLATITAQDVRIAELEQDLRYMNSDHRLQDYAELEDAIVAQAAQLEQASAVILSARSHMALIDWDGCREFISLCDAWLAANAPAPEAEATK